MKRYSVRLSVWSALEVLHALKLNSSKEKRVCIVKPNDEGF